jgi:hypothetical protein
MKLLIIEDDHQRRHKLWQLLAMATQNDIEMNFESDNEQYKGISLTLDISKDVYGFQGFLHYWMEHEGQSDKEENEDDN